MRHSAMTPPLKSNSEPMDRSRKRVEWSNNISSESAAPEDRGNPAWDSETGESYRYSEQKKWLLRILYATRSLYVLKLKRFWILTMVLCVVAEQIICSPTFFPIRITTMRRQEEVPRSSRLVATIAVTTARTKRIPPPALKAMEACTLLALPVGIQIRCMMMNHYSLRHQRFTIIIMVPSLHRTPHKTSIIQSYPIHPDLLDLPLLTPVLSRRLLHHLPPPRLLP
jgi:hypothetical protein